MKKYIYFGLIALFALVSCDKNETVLKNANPKQKVPVSTNIRYFDNFEDVVAEIGKTLSMSFEDLCDYEGEIFFNSCGKIADMMYENVAANQDDYKNLKDIITAIEQYPDHLQIIDEGGGDYRVETKFYKCPERYIINENRMYQVQDTLVKVLDTATIFTTVKNYNDLLEFTDDNISDLIQQIEKGYIKDYIVVLKDPLGPIIYPTGGSTGGSGCGHPKPNKSLGRTIPTKEITDNGGSDKRPRRLQANFAIYYVMLTNEVVEYVWMELKSHRKGAWKCFWWTWKQDITYDVRMDIWGGGCNMDVTFNSSGYDNTITRTAYIYYPNTGNYAFFYKIQGKVWTNYLTLNLNL